MDSRRQLKISSVIQEAFADILTRDGRSIYGKAFVTVTKVWASSDLSLVRFYLSVFGTDAPAEVIDRFEEKKFEIKRKLSERLHNQLRVMPDIEFFLDETLDYAYKIEQVFKKIKDEDERLKAELIKKKEEEEKPKKKKAEAKPKAKKAAAVKKKAPTKRAKK